MKITHNAGIGETLCDGTDEARELGAIGEIPAISCSKAAIFAWIIAISSSVKSSIPSGFPLIFRFWVISSFPSALLGVDAFSNSLSFLSCCSSNSSSLLIVSAADLIFSCAFPKNDFIDPEIDDGVWKPNDELPEERREESVLALNGGVG